MKDVSTVLKDQVFGQFSDDPFLFLFTLIDPTNAFPPIRLVNNIENIVSRGEIYLAFPMLVSLPIEDGETVPSLKIVISNVTMQFMAMFRTLTNPLQGTIEAVLASRPGLVEIAIPDLELKKIEYNLESITVILALRDMLNLGLPSHNFTPTFYPGLFK